MCTCVCMCKCLCVNVWVWVFVCMSECLREFKILSVSGSVCLSMSVFLGECMYFSVSFC